MRSPREPRVRHIRQSEAAISDSTIRGSASAGIRAVSAALRLNNVTIEQSGGCGNGNHRILREFGSNGIFNGNAITANNPNGVLLFGSSHANLNGNAITGNGTSPEASGSGVVLSRSDVEGTDNIIAENKGSGVGAFASSLEFWGGTITNNGRQGVVVPLRCGCLWRRRWAVGGHLVMSTNCATDCGVRTSTQA